MGKVLLEAALRCMASLACAAPAVVIKLQQAGTPPVLALLAHPSPRIQVNAQPACLLQLKATTCNTPLLRHAVYRFAHCGCCWCSCAPQPAAAKPQHRSCCPRCSSWQRQAHHHLCR